MVLAIFDKIAENPEATIAVAIISNLVTAPFWVFFQLKKERRSDNDALYKRAVEFMDRQEAENDKLRAGWANCEKAHERTRKIYNRERQLLQDQITEMTDFIGKRYGHTFQAKPLPEESDEPSPSPPPKRRKKDTDDALPKLQSEGDDEHDD